MDSLSARVIEVRQTYIRNASSTEIENFATFTDSLAALTAYIERLLDEPPQPPAAASWNRAVPRLTDARDPAVVRYSIKVRFCAVLGYGAAIITRRPNLAACLT